MDSLVGELAEAGEARSVVERALTELDERQAVRRVWEKDPALWKPNPAEQQEIEDRLGWLGLPTSMRAALDDLAALASEVRSEGVRHVVLCGMGGSSLAPEVFRLTFGSAAGYPALIVLDSTDPEAVRRVDAAIDPASTLFVISSKSGGTTEVMSFFAHYWEASSGSGQRFCAITDPGTSLEKLAKERGFRRVFLNPSDIGGRYSALSLFGLVPAALIGMDVTRLLDGAARMATACEEQEAERNPGAVLGAFMGGLAREPDRRRDKLTLLASPTLDSFGLWVEQLIAESTGKESTGIVPIVGEPVGAPEAYGDDRAFVALRLEGDDNADLDAVVESLRGRHPLLVLTLADRYDLGGEMYRWEMATALAGALLGINPFDQPNVQESKDNTNRVLADAQASGYVAAPSQDATVDALQAAGFVAQARPGDYVAIQAYLTPTEETEAALQTLRAGIRDRLRVATTLGFGPRFLHSTGQLHKGGPPSGVFLQVTYRPASDLPVPGQPYSFGTLIAAQALGDLQSLRGRGLRAARVDLNGVVGSGLAMLVAGMADRAGQ